PRDFVPSAPQAVRLRERLAPFHVPPDHVVEELRFLWSVALGEIAANDVRTLSNEADVQHDGLDGEDPICRLFGDVRRPDSTRDGALLSRRHRDPEDVFQAPFLAFPTVVGLDQLPSRRGDAAPLARAAEGLKDAIRKALLVWGDIGVESLLFEGRSQHAVDVLQRFAVRRVLEAPKEEEDRTRRWPCRGLPGDPGSSRIFGELYERPDHVDLRAWHAHLYISQGISFRRGDDRVDMPSEEPLERRTEDGENTPFSEARREELDIRVAVPDAMDPQDLGQDESSERVACGLAEHKVDVMSPGDSRPVGREDEDVQRVGK